MGTEQKILSVKQLQKLLAGRRSRDNTSAPNPLSVGVFLLQLKLPQRDQAVKAWNNKHNHKNIYVNTNMSAPMAGKRADLRRKFILVLPQAHWDTYRSCNNR